MIGRMVYDAAADRWCVDMGESDLYELHCGDALEARISGAWSSVRMECDGVGWYLTDSGGQILRGLLGLEVET